jgi:hypothetical protein
MKLWVLAIIAVYLAFYMAWYVLLEGGKPSRRR